MMSVPFPLSFPEEYRLHFPLFTKKVVVHVKEHDRFHSCLAFGKEKISAGCFEMDLFFISFCFFVLCKYVVLMNIFVPPHDVSQK